MELQHSNTAMDDTSVPLKYDTFLRLYHDSFNASFMSENEKNKINFPSNRSQLIKDQTQHNKYDTAEKQGKQ